MMRDVSKSDMVRLRATRDVGFLLRNGLSRWSFDGNQCRSMVELAILSSCQVTETTHGRMPKASGMQSKT